jgi:hypothetical protein
MPYGPFNFCLARLECLIDRHLAGQGGSDVLANLQADRLKLWYSDKLYSDVRDLLNGRVRRVSRLHGLEGARLRNFAAWQVTDRTKKPAFSKYRLLAIGCSRSAGQTAQERHLGNE